MISARARVESRSLPSPGDWTRPILGVGNAAGEGLEGMTVDLSWIEAGLEAWKPSHWTISNLIPSGYDCYLRVLHRAQRAGDASYDELTWREVAEMSGKTLSAMSSFADLLPEDDIGVSAPLTGAIDLGEVLPFRLAGPARRVRPPRPSGRPECGPPDVRGRRCTGRRL